MTFTYDCSKVETLRALAHLLGVKIERDRDDPDYIRLRRPDYVLGVRENDPKSWLSALKRMDRYDQLALPDYVRNWPMSAIDEITDSAGLAAFCDMVGVKVEGPRYPQYGGCYVYKHRRADFMTGDPFHHQKHLVQSLIQAHINEST